MGAIFLVVLPANLFHRLGFYQFLFLSFFPFFLFLFLFFFGFGVTLFSFLGHICCGFFVLRI